MPTFCVGSPAKVDSGTGIVQEKYLTITVPKKNIEEARSYFTRIGADLAAHYAALGSKCVELDATERLRILHDFYRQGEEADFHFSIRDMMKKGHDFRDYINPEGEFAPMVQAMGDDVGTVIHVTAGGKDRLNAMYMVEGYGENNPIVEKSQFIMSLVEQIDKNGVGPQHKSIIDRCTALVYQEAAETGIIPALSTLREKLLVQPEAIAREIALSLELFTTGSLDIFGHGSNVDLDKRVVVFNIHDLGEQLKPTGLLVITDTMLNRVTLNWKRGKRTHVFIDEFHVVFENEYSGNFFNSAWRQFRKRNAYPNAITQNMEYLLDSVQASTMLSNSEFIIMLNQAASDREKPAKLLNISNEQMSYATNADRGRSPGGNAGNGL